MDIKRIESFCKVYELRSISQASQALFFSQPTISTHISFLESELAVSLFDRIGSDLLPTQAGEVLYQYGKNLIYLKDKAYTEIHMLYDRIVGSLHLGGSTIPAHYFLPRLLAKYKKNYQRVNITMQVSDSADIEKKVSICELDLGMVGANHAHSELDYVPVMEDKLVVLGKADLFEQKDKLRKEDLIKLPWVIREKGSGTRKAMEQGLGELGLNLEELNIQAEVNSTEAVLKCIQAGIGVSITSDLAARDLLSEQDILVPRVPELHLRRCFYGIYHKQREFFPAARAFWNILTTQSQNFSKESNQKCLSIFEQID